jgi:RNA polymerase sigma-70 factor (ECF subfamily)
MWVGFATLRRGSSLSRPLSDADAVALAAAGDGGGVTALYDRHARALYALALRIVQIEAEAEDVLQEVFAQVFRQAGRYDAGRGTVLGWLLTITRTRAIDHVRARRRRGDDFSRRASEAAAANLPAPGANQERQALTAEDIQRVRRALDELPAEQRRAIELAYYEGLSQSEIAARLAEPLGTIKSRIRTAMLRLRDALAAESPLKAAKAP